MNCRQCQALLSAYLDSELTGRQMVELRAHLGTCADCSEEFEGLRSLKGLLGAMSLPGPSDGFEKRLAAAVIGSSPPTRLGRGSPIRQSLAFAGVAALAMTITLSVLNQRRAAVAPMTDQGVAFDIQRDQMRAFSTDPYTGTPVVSAAYVNR